MGTTGAKGSRGDDGSLGRTGSSGATGSRGSDGSTGFTGFSGRTGGTGATGSPGNHGATGRCNSTMHSHFNLGVQPSKLEQFHILTGNNAIHADKLIVRFFISQQDVAFVLMKDHDQFKIPFDVQDTK